jgi:hypothetical protein
MRPLFDLFLLTELNGPAFDQITAFHPPLLENSSWHNTRNAVFEVSLADHPCPLLLKKQRLNPEYPKLRRISFYLRNFFKNYGKRSFVGATMLLDAQIKTHTPVAYWKNRSGLFRYESCFLYEKIDAYCNAREYLQDTLETLSLHQKTETIRAMGILARKIHDQGILHGDLVANNYLVCAKSLDNSDASTIQLAVVDTDHVRKNILPLPLGGRTLAMRCFRRWHFNADEQHTFLTSYFDGEYSKVWVQWIEFWRWIDRRPLRHVRALIPGYTPYEKAQTLR